MAAASPTLYLVRHGDTEWTDLHRKTGRTDLPLNARGESRARRLGEILRSFAPAFARVFVSPLRRAAETCELAGFGEAAQVDPDLVEWDYGSFEGMTTAAIVKDWPKWELFRDGCPDGETTLDVAGRADRFLAQIRDVQGDVLVFSSGHIIRMIAARWHRLPPVAGRIFYCEPASLGILGFEHNCREEPITQLWNHSVERVERSATRQPNPTATSS